MSKKIYHHWECDCGHTAVTVAGELPAPHDCPLAPTQEQAAEWAENFKIVASETVAQDGIYTQSNTVWLVHNGPEPRVFDWEDSKPAP